MMPTSKASKTYFVLPKSLTSSGVIERVTSPITVLGGATAKASATNDMRSHELSDLANGRRRIMARSAVVCAIGVVCTCLHVTDGLRSPSCSGCSGVAVAENICVPSRFM